MKEHSPYIQVAKEGLPFRFPAAVSKMPGPGYDKLWLLPLASTKGYHSVPRPQCGGSPAFAGSCLSLAMWPAK